MKAAHKAIDSLKAVLSEENDKTSDAFAFMSHGDRHDIRIVIEILERLLQALERAKEF